MMTIFDLVTFKLMNKYQNRKAFVLQPDNTIRLGAH